MKKSILALQIPSIIANQQINFENLENYIDELIVGKNLEPDFLFLPEVWSVGWYPPCFEDFANDVKTLDFLVSLAKKFSINVFGGSYIRNDNGVLKNSMPVILRNGSVLGYYDKIHLYTPDGEGVLNCGTNPCVFEIEGLRIGVSICYDIRFPELFRSYINLDNPPHLMINLSAWPMSRSEQYSKMAASRAIENQSYFLALSQCGEIKDGVYNSGCSSLVAPMGDFVSKLDEKTGFIYSEIDTDNVNSVRDTFPNLSNRKVDNFGFVVKEYFACEVEC